MSHPSIKTRTVTVHFSEARLTVPEHALLRAGQEMLCNGGALENNINSLDGDRVNIFTRSCAEQCCDWLHCHKSMRELLARALQTWLIAEFSMKLRFHMAALPDEYEGKPQWWQLTAQ